MAEAAAPCHSTVTEKGRVRIQGRDCSGRGSEIISEVFAAAPSLSPRLPRTLTPPNHLDQRRVERLRDRLASRQPVFKPESSLILKLFSPSVSHSPRLQAREMC